MDNFLAHNWDIPISDREIMAEFIALIRKGSWVKEDDSGFYLIGTIPFSYGDFSIILRDPKSDCAVAFSHPERESLVCTNIISICNIKSNIYFEILIGREIKARSRSSNFRFSEYSMTYGSIFSIESRH